MCVCVCVCVCIFVCMCMCLRVCVYGYVLCVMHARSYAHPCIHECMQALEECQASHDAKSIQNVKLSPYKGELQHMFT